MSMLRIAGACAVLVCAGVASGCTSEKAPTGTSLAQAGVSARINDRAWQSVSPATGGDNAYFAVPGGSNSNELTIIGIGTFESASTGTGMDRITLAMTGVTGPGVIPLSLTNRGVFTEGSGAVRSYATDANNTGVVTITSYDSTRGLVSGTFTFAGVSGASRVTVAEGRFTEVPLRR